MRGPVNSNSAIKEVTCAVPPVVASVGTSVVPSVLTFVVSSVLTSILPPIGTSVVPSVVLCSPLE